MPRVMSCFAVILCGCSATARAPGGTHNDDGHADDASEPDATSLEAAPVDLDAGEMTPCTKNEYLALYATGMGSFGGLGCQPIPDACVATPTCACLIQVQPSFLDECSDDAGMLTIVLPH